MANSLEFSPSGHPIENRYDAYGEFLADSLPEDPETTRENQDRITRRIDAQRAAFLASGVPDDYDPFDPLSDEDERQERIDRLAATIQVRPDSNCIAGWEYLAFVPGFEEDGWDHHGPTPEAARESLIDYLQVVVQ